jgi:hypothetical protein
MVNDRSAGPGMRRAQPGASGLGTARSPVAEIHVGQCRTVLSRASILRPQSQSRRDRQALGSAVDSTLSDHGSHGERAPTRRSARLQRTGPKGLFQYRSADTRAAMTAGSAAVSDLKESSVWGSWPDRRPWPGQETGGPLCAVRADLPGLCGGIGDACGPKSLGFHPGGLGPHLTSSGFPWRAFLRFPVCPPRFVPVARLRMVSLRPAFSGCTLRPSPGSGSPPGSLPPGDLHVSAAAGRCRRRWSRSARTKVTSSASAPSLGSPAIRPRCRRAAAGHERCRRRIAWYERPRAHDVTAPSRNR